MGSIPYAFILDINLYQNFNAVYPFNIKTRRWTSARKMYQSPLYFNYLFKKLLNSTLFFNTYSQLVVSIYLVYYYLDSNVWHFYRNLAFKNNGSLTNNLSLSLTSKALLDNISNLTHLKVSSWTRLKIHSKLYYLKEVRLLPFALKKNAFNRIVFLILFLLAQPMASFLNHTNMTYSFLFISNNVNLFTFYSYFYFRVYNF